MFVLHRIALPSINAIFVTIGLLYAMFLLVNIVEPELAAAERFTPVEFVYVPEETNVRIKIVKPEPPKDIEIAPEVVVDSPIIERDVNINTQWTTNDVVAREITLNSINDSQLVLAIGFPPEYPQSAVTKGIEGYAVVGFSVDTSGAVYDAYIIESEPGNTFDRSALKAIMKFRYKAGMVNGKPIKTKGQRYMFSYKMDD